LDLQFWDSLNHTTKTGHEALQKAGFLQYPPVIKHGVLENLYLQMILPAFFTSISREFRKKKQKKLYFQGISRVFPGYFQL
jgi:hypothetical protein